MATTYGYGAMGIKHGNRATDAFYALDENNDPSGGTTFTAPVTVNMLDGQARIEEDQFANCGVTVNRTFAAAPDTQRSYMNCECRDSNGNLLSYGGMAHQNNGTGLGLLTQFVGLDASLNEIGYLQFIKGVGPTGAAVLQGGQGTNNNRVSIADDKIEFGSGTSVMPNVRVAGTGGSGQVYDTLYNNPNLPSEQSPLGAGFQTATTTGTGTYTPVVPAFDVNALGYYRISLAGILSATAPGATGGMALTVKFNNTADQIILAEYDGDTTGDNFVSTIEFRVPATNTQMTIGVEGRTKGSPWTVGEVTGGWSSLSIVQLT